MKKQKIRVLDFFAGTGAFDSALDRLGIQYELVDAVEIDKYAMASFNAVHGTNFECQDITKWDKDVGEIDILWQSSPCQSLSMAGKGHGADKGSGTRSSLVWEIIRIAEKVKPSIIIWENVKGLVSKKHKHNHTEYMNELEKLGYNSYWKVLNSKNFCVPQNRDRCFTVSIRKDIDDGNFEFPEDTLLTRRLKDILEPSVDEKYYISSKQLAGMARTKFNSYNLKNLLRDKDGEAKTLTARFEGCPQLVDQPLYQKAIDTACEKGMVKPTDVIEYTYSNARTKEVEQGYIKKQNQGNSDIMPTLRTNPQQLGVAVEEPKLDFVGGIGDKDRIGDGKKLSRNYPEGNRVYSANGIAKTQAAQGGGIGGVSGLYEVDEPFIAASRGRSKGDWNESEHYQQLEPREDGLTNTISSVAKDNYVVEPNLKTKLCNDLVEQGIVHGGEVINHSYTNSDQRKELKDYIENDTGVMPTLTTRPDIMGYVEGQPNVRIRKLSPLECWRLQAYHDDEFERAAYNKYNDTLEKLCSAKLRGVIEKREQNDSATYALNITNALRELGITSTVWTSLTSESLNENIPSANVAIEMLDGREHLDSATNITKCLENGETLCTLMDELDQKPQEVIIELENEGKGSTEKYMKITLVENLNPQRLFIILTLIKLITKSKIYGSTLLTLNIQKLTINYADYGNNMEKMPILSLEMVATTTRVSKAALYKQAGNGCTVSVLAALMSQLDILGVKPWNEMTLKEREKLVYV